MPASDGTVRGTFDLDTPALDKIHSLRDAGLEADSVMHRLGDTLDSLGRDTGGVTHFRDSLRDLGTTANDVATGVAMDWSNMRRAVDEDSRAMRKSIDDLDLKMDALGAKHATPRVSIDGIDEAKVKLDELDAKLDAFNRKRATAIATIRTDRTGGGAGGIGGAAAAAASGGDSGGPGGLWGMVSKASMLAGIPWWAYLLPVAPQLAGGAAGLAGSLGAGALGAGALGAAGVGALGVGGGLPAMLAMRTQMGPITQLAQQDQKLQAEQQVLAATPYGSLSPAQLSAQEAQLRKSAATGNPQAVQKLAELQRAKQTRSAITSQQQQIALAQAGASPQQVQAATSLAGLEQWWQTASGQMSQPLVGLLGTTAGRARGIGQQLMPSWTRSMGSIQSAGDALTQWGGERQQIQTAQYMAQGFQAVLPGIELDLEHILTAFENISKAAMPFFAAGVRWSEQWTEKIALSTGDTVRMHDEISRLVSDFRLWMVTTGELGRLLKDLMVAGEPSGNSLVGSLDKTLTRWDEWVKTHPAEIRSYFHESAVTVKELATALSDVVGALGQLLPLIMPIANEFASLASSFGAAGLFLPGGVGLGANLIREKLLGRAGGGAAGGAITSAEASALAASGGPGAAVSGAIAPAAFANFLAPVRNVPLANPAAVLPEAGARIYGEGFQYGGPASELGLAGRAGFFNSIMPGIEGGLGAGLLGGASQLGGMALSGLSAVAPYALTAMLASGALSALQHGTGGAGAGGLGQNFLSGASFGLIHPVSSPSGSDVQAQAAQAAINAITSGVGGRVRTGSRSNLFGESSSMALTIPTYQNIGALPGGALPASPTSLRQAEAGYSALVGRVHELGVEAQHAHGKSLDAINGEIQGVNQLKDAYDQYQQQQAQALSPKYQQAFGILSRREGPLAAMKSITSQVFSEMRRMSPAGAQILGNNMLAWADAMKKKNPALTGVVNELNKEIQDSFSLTGQRVKIVNDTILTGSTQEWQQIGQALTDPVERATEKVTAGFTQIQQEAIGSLEAMGFSSGEAKNLVGDIAKGGRSSTYANATVGAMQNPASAILPGGNMNAILAGPGAGGKRDIGGRLPGSGLFDTVRMSDGGFGAPGELVVNRHTERDVNADLAAAGKPPLAVRVAHEHRPHWAAYDNDDIPPDAALARAMRSVGGAVGAALAGVAGTGAGAGGGAFASMVAEANRIASMHYPYAWGGGHNQAFSGPYDCSGAVSAVLHAGGMLSQPMTSGDLMGWGLPGPGDVTIYANPGHTFMSIGGHGFGTSYTNPGGGAGWLPYNSRPGFAVRHAPAAGSAAAMAMLGGASPGMASSLSLKAPTTGMKGIPGAMGDAALGAYTAGLQQKVNAQISGMMGMIPGLSGFSGGGSSGANMTLGHQMMLAAGWPESEWPSLQALWTQESGWNANAVNPSSGAMGIPQALGHGNPFPLGQAAPQIAWGLNYIRQRYGSPSVAEAHERANNWYTHGGRLGAAMLANTGGMLPNVAWGGWHGSGLDTVVTRPTLFGAGERGAERVKVSPTPSSSRAGAAASAPRVHVEISGPVHIKSDADIEKIAERVGWKVIEVLDRTQVPGAAG